MQQQHRAARLHTVRHDAATAPHQAGIGPARDGPPVHALRKRPPPGSSSTGLQGCTQPMLRCCSVSGNMQAARAAHYQSHTMQASIRKDRLTKRLGRHLHRLQVCFPAAERTRVAAAARRPASDSAAVISSPSVKHKPAASPAAEGTPGSLHTCFMSESAQGCTKKQGTCMVHSPPGCW